MNPTTDAFEMMIADGDVCRDLFDQHVLRHPNKLFLFHGDSDTRLTFAQVRETTDIMAAGLHDLGVRKGDHVSVHSRDALTTALAMFAIWRCGAVFAPVNYNLRGDFLTYQIQDTAPKVLIADAEGVPLIQSHFEQGRGFALVGPGAEIEKLEGATVPEVPLGPADAAAIIYTSGTTGPAKGVKLGHRWINQYCFNPRALNTSDDAFHCDLPLYHVGGAFSILARAAWLGSTIGLWDRFSSTSFWNRINTVGASCATLLDVMIPHILSRPQSVDDRANPLNKVHIQPHSMRHHEFATRFGVDFMTVGFGQTESGSVFGGILNEFPEDQGTPGALWKGLSKADYLDAARSLGRPVFDGRKELPKGIMGAPSPMFEVAVLDENDEPVKVGQVGQMCLRPAHPSMILQEYINKPEATAKVLKNCWFHTGDAIRQLEGADQLFVFVDRMGGFFRVRGENVSSFEVESVMLRFPGVRAAAAVPVPAVTGEEDDIAVFIEAEEGAVIEEDRLRDFAAAQMPPYMQPRYLRVVTELPVTPTNKIEKYKLRRSLLADLAEMKETSR